MEWTEEQKQNILQHYDTIEQYEKITRERQAEKYLADTDYIVIKAYEYSMTGAKLDKDYTDIFDKREEMREVLRKIREEK